MIASVPFSFQSTLPPVFPICCNAPLSPFWSLLPSDEAFSHESHPPLSEKPPLSTRAVPWPTLHLHPIILQSHSPLPPTLSLCPHRLAFPLSCLLCAPPLPLSPGCSCCPSFFQQPKCCSTSQSVQLPWSPRQCLQLRWLLATNGHIGITHLSNHHTLPPQHHTAWGLHPWDTMLSRSQHH